MERQRELEEWLIKINYNLIVVRNQILKVMAFSRDTLLGRVKELKNDVRLTLTLTYHLTFRSL